MLRILFLISFNKYVLSLFFIIMIPGIILVMLGSSLLAISEALSNFCIQSWHIIMDIWQMTEGYHNLLLICIFTLIFFIRLKYYLYVIKINKEQKETSNEIIEVNTKLS